MPDMTSKQREQTGALDEINIQAALKQRFPPQG